MTFSERALYAIARIGAWVLDHTTERTVTRFANLTDSEETP